MESFACSPPCLLQDLPALAAVPGAAGIPLEGVTFLGYPRQHYLTFCEAPQDRAVTDADADADASVDSTILIPHHLVDTAAGRWPAATLVGVDDPRACFIDALRYLCVRGMIGPSSLLPVQPFISPEARIGRGAIIEPGVQIDEDVVVGSGSVVHAGTWLRKGAILGDNCVIGGTGINAYAGRDGRRRAFPHVAGVIIGEHTQLGAGCVVVRGILSSTRIGANSILGNLCNVGHGVEIANDVWISVGTLVGGHTRIGAGATLAMGCTIRDNLRIGNRASIGMGSVVTKHVRDGAAVFGNPARTQPSVNAGPTR